MHGVVTEFDDAAGLGTVTADDGSPYRFHCTAISDGTRTIPVGTAVEFDTRPARDGTYEASPVTPRR